MSKDNRPSEGEIYTPIMDDDGFDVREASGKRAMFLLIGAFVFLLALAIGLLKAYGPGTRGPDEPPRILADTSPYKSAPENPGGAETPNQDKTVYDVVSGDSRAENVVLAPVAEEPIRIEPREDQATVIVKQPEAAMPVAPVPVPAPAMTAPTRPQVASPPAPTYTTPVTPPAQQVQGAQVQIGNSDYVVQVASLRSVDEANTMWNTLNTKHGAVIPSGLYADIMRADLGDKGVYHRLRVAGFASKESATAFCNRLKSRSQDCLIVRK